MRFTEKDDAGATHLYPLTDFHPRKEENLERGYLQGRYGAIPFLGELVSNVGFEGSGNDEPGHAPGRDKLGSYASGGEKPDGDEVA